MASSMLNRIKALEPLAQAQTGVVEEAVYGVVDRLNEDGTPHFIRKWKGTIGNMRATDEEPTIYLIEKLERALLKHKKYKCFYGGRAGTKSIFAMDVLSGDVNSCGSKVFVLRERMTSLRQSIYAGIKDRIRELSLSGFTPLPSRWEITHKSGGGFVFGGMQNIIDMKGSFKFKIFLMEEAARTSQETIDTLGPTLRGVEGAELWYVWNNESSNDPMSLEFINPYQAELDKNGYYEDEYHMIIKVGYEDNPWFEQDESLSGERKKDWAKVQAGTMQRARYAHIWEGAMNDEISNGVIDPDWFDACVDSHKKLGFDPKGAVIATCDPSDQGRDPTGYSVRKGVVFSDVREIEGEDGNRKFDIACRDAKQEGCDSFGWDCDGMGALLRDQAGANFNGTKVHTFMYKGSEGVNRPNEIFSEAGDYSIKGQPKNKDVFANKKAQNIIAFANRVKRTYEAVVNGKYIDPDELVSFDSETIPADMLSKLRAECCRMPLKPADTIKFYTKEEMRRGITQPDGSKIKIPSPNLFDAVVLSFDDSSIINKKKFTPIQYETLL